MVLLAAGVWLSMHRSSVQTDRGGGSVFADLKTALGEIEEIRLSKGDGSRTTLHQQCRRLDRGGTPVPGRCARACASSRWDSPACAIVEQQDQRSG